MKPKILLIQEASKKTRYYINSLPPLGILSIASYLETQGIDVKVIDRQIGMDFSNDPREFDIAGLSINLANISSSLRLINQLKSRNRQLKIIVGGPSCISNPDFFTSCKDIDAICTGEGEESLFDYVSKEGFINGKRIKGLLTKTKEGDFVSGGTRDYIKSLDSLPFASLNKVDIKKYSVPLSKRSPISSINSSRGCPYRCSFCFHSMGYLWRARSPKNVVDEIEWQVNELGIREICIEDDNFLLDIKRAEEILDLIIRRNIKVSLQLHNGVRIEDLDFDLLKKMRAAGVWLIIISPETGSPKVMQSINKKTDKIKNKQIVEWCRRIGIKTYACFVFGFPCETLDDLEMSISFMQDLNPDFVQISRALPIPGTPLYEQVADRYNKDDFMREEGMHFGGQKLKDSQIDIRDFKRMINKAYRKFYLRPLKILGLLCILSPRKMWKLFIYALKTESI